MNENTLINLALKIAMNAHDGQYRRDGKTPYIQHPINVANRVKHLGEKYIVVAYLHDVLEDTNTTAKDLIEAGINEDLVEAIQVLTKNPNYSYDEYLKNVKYNSIARQVKIADMLSNLGDNPTNKQIRKYAKGLLFLVDEVTS